ncbi:uncharacterized protein LOC135221958 [Macrobrachium nipponense]|uniref:uncharacterized protein LOC135221958 n=1 Tax=Macrobrachium nipponense TaxID=159736 RepID=UPI0030C7B92D
MVMLTLSLAGPFTCILMIIGLCCDIRFMLLPWLVDAVLVIAFDLIFVAYVIYQEHTNINPVMALTFTFEFFSLVLNIYAVLCVISQYQEYLEGRGTARDEGSRSPPVIRFSRRSTLNSGMDSTRRTVTFLEQGVITNGISPTHNSHVSRAPSIVKKGGLCSDRINSDHAANTLTVSGPNGTRLSRSVKKHVQFPAETIEESETSEGDNCEIFASTLENKVKNPHLSLPTESLTKDRGKNSIDSCINEDPRKDSEAPCISSPHGDDATLLIKAEGSGEVTRY